MITLVPAEVYCYSGYKADESPKSFSIKDRMFVIKEISDRWYQGETNPEVPASDYFKVITIEDEQYILKHEIKNDRWYLCR